VYAAAGGATFPAPRSGSALEPTPRPELEPLASSTHCVYGEQRFKYLERRLFFPHVENARMTRSQTWQRALAALTATGVDAAQAEHVLNSLSSAGFSLVDDHGDELACRWVDVQQRPVPPEADTIIRTITTTVGDRTSSTTHWLEGLRSPRSAQLPFAP
jgi:hypothetical protein